MELKDKVLMIISSFIKELMDLQSETNIESKFSKLHNRNSKISEYFRELTTQINYLDKYEFFLIGNSDEMKDFDWIVGNNIYALKQIYNDIDQSALVIDLNISKINQILLNYYSVIILLYKEKIFVELNTNDLKDATAVLTLNDETKKATLIEFLETSLMDRRTSQRQANGICKIGLPLLSGMKRVVGTGCNLETILVSGGIKETLIEIKQFYLGSDFFFQLS